MLVYLSLLLFYKNNVKRKCIAQLLFKSLCHAANATSNVIHSSSTINKGACVHFVRAI